MTDKENELTELLRNTREQLSVLQSLLAREHEIVDHKQDCVNNAKLIIDNMLYELTGNEFYRNKAIGGNDETRDTDQFPA